MRSISRTYAKITIETLHILDKYACNHAHLFQNQNVYTNVANNLYKLKLKNRTTPVRNE